MLRGGHEVSSIKSHANGSPTGALGALTVLATGCASTPAPNAEFADTKGVTSAAEASGAQDIPEASLYLKMSKDARLAASEGEREMHQAVLSDAEQEYSELQDELRIEAEAGLEQTRKELLVTQNEFGMLIAEMRSTDDDLNATEALSLERAEAVRNYLLSAGVRGGSLRAVGQGESAPIADNQSVEGRANNRRVEIVIPK